MPLIVKLKPAVREKLERLLSQGVPLRTACEGNDGPTQDEVREALKKLVIKDKELAKKLLAKYKAKSLPELAEEHYAKVIAEALKLAK